MEATDKRINESYHCFRNFRIGHLGWEIYLRCKPIKMNSTGTSIQKIGGKYYAFMGGLGNLRAHSYPDLELLGELNLDLQPHWPEPAKRVWASLVPLPEGYSYRYVLLTMDRPNFPGIKGANWSYGALYFYGANIGY